MTSAAAAANQSAKDVARSAPVTIGARVGIVAYGITHLLVGWLALQVAFGHGGEKADQGGAFETLLRQPFGPLLLWILVAGFVATALWRLGQVFWGFGYASDTVTKVRKRASSGVKVVVFVALAVLAGQTAAGGGGGAKQGPTAGVLGLPGGQLLVGAVGVGLLVTGVVTAVRGWLKKFLDDMALPSDPRAREVAERTGQVGSIAKGVSIGLIGVLVVVAAIRFRPDEASGLDVALRSLSAQPFGPYLLAAVALGLMAYGVFCFFDARYHRV